MEGSSITISLSRLFMDEADKSLSFKGSSAKFISQLTLIISIWLVHSQYIWYSCYKYSDINGKKNIILFIYIFS